MTNTERLPSSLFSRTGLVILFGILAFGLTGCYTQVQVADRTGHRTSDAKQSYQKQDDRPAAYADEYRREYRQDARPDQTRRKTATYQYNYYFDRGSAYHGWDYDLYVHDAWAPHPTPWHYDPLYRSRISFSVYFGSPYSHVRPWRYYYRSGLHFGYGPDAYRPYGNYYFGDHYYYDDVYYGDVQDERSRRDYRPRGATVGHNSSNASRRASRSSNEATARARSGRIGRSGDDARSARSRDNARSVRIGRSDRSTRSRASRRAERSSRDADDRRARRSPQQRSERSARTRSGEDSRDRSGRSRSGNRQRTESGSSRSESKGRSRGRSESDDDNTGRLRSDAYRSPSSDSGRIGRRKSARTLRRSAREALPNRIRGPEYSDRMAELKKQRRKRSSSRFGTRSDRASNDRPQRAQRSRSSRQRSSPDRSSSSNRKTRSSRDDRSSRGTSRSSRNTSSSRSDDGDRSRGSRDDNGR